MSTRYSNEEGFSPEPEEIPLTLREQTLQNEAKIADPDQQLSFFLSKKIVQEIAEQYRKKTDKELSTQQEVRMGLQVGQVTTLRRGDLQDAGIALMNVVSRDGEKRLLEATIEIEGKPVNLAQYSFFTTEELQIIKQWQKNDRESRTIKVDFNSLRDTAFDLFDKVTHYPEQKRSAERQLVIEAIEELKTELTESEQENLDRFLNPQVRLGEGITMIEKSFLYHLIQVYSSQEGFFEAIASEEQRSAVLAMMAETFHEMYPRFVSEAPNYMQTLLDRILPQDDTENWRDYLKTEPEIQDRRPNPPSPGLILMLSGINTNFDLDGITINGVGTRFGALAGLPSPLIESGFIFAGNPDLTLEYPDGKIRRLNMMVVHLWSQELDEMGGGKDQIYLTAEEFTELQSSVESFSLDINTPENRDKVKTFLRRRSL